MTIDALFTYVRGTRDNAFLSAEWQRADLFAAGSFTIL